MRRRSHRDRIDNAKNRKREPTADEIPLRDVGALSAVGSGSLTPERSVLATDGSGFSNESEGAGLMIIGGASALGCACVAAIESVESKFGCD